MTEAPDTMQVEARHLNLVKELVEQNVFEDQSACLRFAMALGIRIGRKQPLSQPQSVEISGALNAWHGAVAAWSAGSLSVLTAERAPSHQTLTAQFANGGLDRLAEAAPRSPVDLIAVYDAAMLESA